MEKGKVLPSVSEFMNICRCLKVEPSYFFDYGLDKTKKIEDIASNLEKLDENQIDDISAMIKGLIKFKK